MQRGWWCCHGVGSRIPLHCISARWLSGPTAVLSGNYERMEFTAQQLCALLPSLLTSLSFLLSPLCLLSPMAVKTEAKQNKQDTKFTKASKMTLHRPGVRSLFLGQGQEVNKCRAGVVRSGLQLPNPAILFAKTARDDTVVLWKGDWFQDPSAARIH